MSDSETESDAGEVRPQQDWDAVLEPVVKFVLGKKGVKTKSASEVGKKKVDYFRGKDLVNFMLKHDKPLQRRCKKALDKYLNGEAPQKQEDVMVLGTALMAKGFIHGAKYHPLNTNTKKNEDGEPKEKKEKKWPDRLVKISMKEFDPEGFYMILWEGSKFWTYFLMVALVLCIIAGSAFQAWPIWLKIGSWYTLVGILTLYFFVEFCRMSGYATFWIVGCDFWILPNLNDEYCGILDSFKPLYSFERRKDTFTMIGVRAVTLIVLVVAAQEISRTHSLSDVKDFVQGSYIDMVDHVTDKYLIGMTPETTKKNIPSLEYLQKEEELEKQNEKEHEMKNAAGSAEVEAEVDADGEASIFEDSEVVDEEVVEG